MATRIGGSVELEPLPEHVEHADVRRRLVEGGQEGAAERVPMDALLLLPRLGLGGGDVGDEIAFDQGQIGVVGGGGWET